MHNHKNINIFQWTLGIIMLISIIPFTYLALNQNWIATIFMMAIIVYLVALKLSFHKKFLPNEETHYLAYMASYLSEIVTITAILIVAAYEIYQEAEIGIWFYVVLGTITISRPLFFLILKKLE
jgi:hypothetical protein